MHCTYTLHFVLCFSEPGLLRESLSLTDRCLSNDSIKASSGEVSPYDNNSPVLSDRLLCKYPEGSSPPTERIPRLSGQYKRYSCSKEGSGTTSPTLSTDKGDYFSIVKRNTLTYFAEIDTRFMSRTISISIINK